MEPRMGLLVASHDIDKNWEIVVMRYALLWLLGIPIPVLLLIWMFGGLH